MQSQCSLYECTTRVILYGWIYEYEIDAARQVGNTIELSIFATTYSKVFSCKMVKNVSLGINCLRRVGILLSLLLQTKLGIHVYLKRIRERRLIECRE